jgi:hypothetical protein
MVISPRSGAGRGLLLLALFNSSGGSKQGNLAKMQWKAPNWTGSKHYFHLQMILVYWESKGIHIYQNTIRISKSSKVVGLTDEHMRIGVFLPTAMNNATVK